jgi:hypothetical protein
MSKRKKKQKKETPIEYQLYLSYSETEEGGAICEGEEGPYCSHEPVYITFTPLGVHRERGDSQETITINFDPSTVEDVYLVIVRYSSGSTFGSSYGNWHVESAYKDKDVAFSVSATIRDDTYPGYKPWEGYFESLESVEVWGTSLKDGPCGGIKWF